MAETPTAAPVGLAAAGVGAWFGAGGSFRCPFQGQAHPHFSFFFPFSSSSCWGSGMQQRFSLQFQFSCFSHPPAELPGVALLRPRLGLGAPGRLVGGAPWCLVCCSAGITATHRESIDRIEGWEMYTSVIVRAR